MSLPDFFVLENGPVPGGDIIRWITLDRASPQSQKEIRVIQNRKVHQIHSEDARYAKCVKPRKERGLAKTGFEAIFVVLTRVSS
jgi:hypothetical protein